MIHILKPRPFYLQNMARQRIIDDLNINAKFVIGIIATHDFIEVTKNDNPFDFNELNDYLIADGLMPIDIATCYEYFYNQKSATLIGVSEDARYYIMRRTNENS